MSRLSALRAALTALILIVLGLPAAAQAVVQDVGGAPVVFVGPANAPVTVLMFPGGDGKVSFNAAGDVVSNNNFLLRTRQLWLAQGFAYAALGSPSSLMGQRHTPAYAQTIGRALDFLRSRGTAPVWLVGNSMGSIAAANGAAHLPGRVAGVVMTSSVASENRNRETVFDSDLGAIAVPALIVANRGDNCPNAGPGFAPNILAALARAPRKEIIYVDSHQLQSDPCEALSPHGYLGIESDVVARIASWIRANS